MNGEKMGTEEGFDSYASDEWTTEDSHDRQQFAMNVESFFDDLKEKIEKKVDELSQTVEEKITIRMEELLQEMEDRISNRTSQILAKAEEHSQIPPKKRKQYVISIDGTDNLDTSSVDHLDERNHHHSQALNERVEVLETSVNKLLQAVFPRVETSQQLPDSSKSPNTFTVDPSFVCDRVPSNPPKLTTFPRTCLVRGKNCTHGTEGLLKEGNRLKQNVKGTQTFNSIPKASPSFTVEKDKSTCLIKDKRLRELTSSAKSHKLLTDHFEQCTSSGEESSDDIVEKEQTSTDRKTISSKYPEKPRENQTGYTEMLDFQTAISGYSFSSTSVNPACSVKPRQYSNSSLPTSPTGKMCGSGSCDTSEEKSRDTPYADDTFSTMIDLSSEIVAPSQPCSREKSPVPQPAVCGLPLNSYIVVKVLSDGDTSASEGLKNPIKEMILPIFDHPTSNTRISTVSKQKQSTKREGLVCVPPPIETLSQPEIKTNNKTEDRSNAASGTGTRSKFRIPATISSDHCRPSSTTDVMSSVSTGFLPTGHLKTVVEKLVEEPRVLRDTGATNTARRLCSGTPAHKLTQQSDRSLPSTCRTPFEELKVQIATRKSSGTLTSSNICSLSSTPSQSLPLTISASTIERRVDQSRATSDSSQSSASHRLLSSTGRSPLTSTPGLDSITDSRVDQSTALSDTSQSSASHRRLSTTGYSSPTTSSRVLESTTGRRDDPSSVLSDTSQSSNTHRPPSSGTHLSPTTSPPRVLESIIERRVDQSRALRYAAAEGRVAELRQLLADGADPDARNAEGCTALHCAARRGMWLAVNALLDAGANAHAKDRVGWTALHCAAAYDPAALCVTALAKAGADVNERSNSKLTPLHLAAKYNNEKAARALLEAGACKTIKDAHGRTPIQVMGNAMEHLPVAAPLSPAPRDKEAERRRFWDEELLAAVEQGNLHQAEAALREGASVDARDVEGGGGGWTALHLAASRGDTALVRLLLESGAHPGRRDAYGWTALHFAASTDFALGVRLLACAGADPEARDAFGCTPLHLAARWDRQAALLELLRLGANAHAHDARGLTPFERAPSARVRRLLRSQGAAHAGSRAAAARGDLAHGVRYRVSVDGSEDVELPKSPFDKVPDFSAWRILRRNKSNEGAELATSHGNVAETKKNEHSPKGEKEKVSNVTTDPNIQEYNPDVSDTNELAMQERCDSGEIQMEKTSESADTFARVSITENKENIDSENKDESETKLSN